MNICLTMGVSYFLGRTCYKLADDGIENALNVKTVYKGASPGICLHNKLFGGRIVFYANEEKAKKQRLLHCSISVGKLIPKNWLRTTKIMSYVLSYFTPILKIRLLSTEYSKVTKNRYYIKQVSAYQIGLVGTLFAGINSDWYSRVKADPIKFIVGVVELITVAHMIMTVSQIILLTSVPTYALTSMVIGIVLA